MRMDGLTSLRGRNFLLAQAMASHVLHWIATAADTAGTRSLHWTLNAEWTPAATARATLANSNSDRKDSRESVTFMVDGMRVECIILRYSQPEV